MTGGGGRRLGLASALAAASVLAGAAGAGHAMRGPRQEDPFPHARHQGLFPLCTGCHQGIETGDPATVHPEPSSCDGCHDGVDEAEVAWDGPTPDPSNLDFSHGVHEGAVAGAGDPALACARCHAPAGADRMVVEPLDAGRCLDCHGHPAPPSEHLTGAACAVCHVPAAAADLPPERFEAIPVPDDHASGSFIRPRHGDVALEGASRCATCHVRQRCEACHVDPDREAIRAVPAAPPGAPAPSTVAHYPVPRSHVAGPFEEEHGRGLDAREANAACATCHTRDDCAACHIGPGGALDGLPSRAASPAPGVGIRAGVPRSHEGAFFLRAHPTLAAADPASCTTCHEEPFCAGCHDAPRGPVFHPDDFVARHASASFGASSECSTCHDAERFCRSCHVDAGLGSRGRLGPGYHDAEPVWLLRHGQAARQELESCASCHRQRECLQCHGQTGAFRISPHRDGFDARRAWERNPVVCMACHLRPPFERVPEP